MIMGIFPPPIPYSFVFLLDFSFEFPIHFRCMAGGGGGCLFWKVEKRKGMIPSALPGITFLFPSKL